MNGNDFNKILENMRQTEDALSVTVKISQNQALDVVVNDLISKYLFNIERRDKEWVWVFKKILRYYLTGEELRHLTKKTQPTKTAGG